MANESRLAQAQKADLWDKAVTENQIKQQASAQAERGYAAGIMDGVNRANMSWANTLRHRLNTPVGIPDADTARMENGAYVNSVNGYDAGLAAKAAKQDAWVAQSVVPRADTQYPTYKGQ